MRWTRTLYSYQDVRDFAENFRTETRTGGAYASFIEAQGPAYTLLKYKAIEENAFWKNYTGRIFAKAALAILTMGISLIGNAIDEFQK